jgi:hypothetical protein
VSAYWVKVEQIWCRVGLVRTVMALGYINGGGFLNKMNDCHHLKETVPCS